MFDFAWSEFAVIGLVAVVVLGPKELPQAMRALGRFTRQARKLAGEFQGHVNDLIREAELEDIKSTVQKATNLNVASEMNNLLDPGGEFAAELARTEEEMKAALSTSPTAPALTTPAAEPAPSVAAAQPAPAMALPSNDPQAVETPSAPRSHT